MNQEQFDLIVKIIRRGAPALADELVQSIVLLITEHAKLQKQLTEMGASSEPVEPQVEKED